jgi:uncharacterized OB-fold protein
MRTGTVYTETVIYSAPESFAQDVPYQTAIVSLNGDGGSNGRVTARITGDRVAIGDLVIEVEPGAVAEASGDRLAGVPLFRKA